MPGQRYRQAGFWRYRWAKCSICGITERYEVKAQKGWRLRERKCMGCGAVLGRHAGTRAAPSVRAAAAVEKLARKMGVRDAHVRP
jgi:hypothetical protein